MRVAQRGCEAYHATQWRALPVAQPLQGLRNIRPPFPRVITTMCLLTGFLGACGHGHDWKELQAPTVPRDTNDIVVGAFGDLQGEGGVRLRAMNAELERFNAAGGARGRAVRLLAYDDQGRAEGMRAALERLVDSDKVVALVPLHGADRAQAAAQHASGTPVLALSKKQDSSADAMARELSAWMTRTKTYDKADLQAASDGPPPLPDYSIKPPPKAP